MPNYNYTLKSLNLDKKLGNNSPVQVLTPKGLLTLEGVILPYTGDVSSTVYLSNTLSTYSMNNLTTDINISLPENDDEILNLNTFGNIVSAFNDVGHRINAMPPAIVTNITVTDTNFNMTSLPVIIFNRIGPNLTVTYPDTWTHTFNNTYHYTWYFQRICSPLSYRIKLLRYNKNNCI